MKVYILKSFFLILLITAICGACKKDDEGDNTGTEEKDGQITFYTNSADCGDISLTLNNENIGPLSVIYTGGTTPDCGAENTLTIGVDVGVYNYYAEDSCNNIWSGTIHINMGDCKVKFLER